MMSELKPFNAKSKCPKCGSDIVSTRHRPRIEDDAEWYGREFQPIGKWPKHEFLQRTCSLCGYEWPEAVKP